MHCDSLQSHRHLRGSLGGSAPQFLRRRRYSASLHQHSLNTATSRLYSFFNVKKLSAICIVDSVLTIYHKNSNIMRAIVAN